MSCVYQVEWTMVEGIKTQQLVLLDCAGHIVNIHVDGLLIQR